MKKLAQHVPALSLFSQVISTSVALGGSLMYLCKEANGGERWPTILVFHCIFNRTQGNQKIAAVGPTEKCVWRLVSLPSRTTRWLIPRPEPHLVHGFTCKFCIERTGIFQVMSGHITSAHEKQKLQLGVRRNAMYEPVSLQAWTKSPSGGRYWIVEYGGSSTRPVGGKEVYDHLEDVFERERGRQKGFSGGELTNGAGTTRSSQTTTFTDLRLWLERTGWERTFGGIDRELLKNLTTTPCPATSHRGLILKESSNRSSDVYSDEWMISSADDERKITALLAAVDMVMDRCEQTARTISRSLLCWLRSIRPHGCYAKPFTFVRKAASRRKYICLLKRFVALVFRAYRLPADIR
ncbi:Uncharacterized protein HZ326_22096 [Fusarium oxysporum f. sp. albedinis]|nr:Uncharacterized protein HZ326_22096 [Fusarium oxysporum f. sp. albedinis]